KHVNWSLSTDDGINLLEPGKTPHDNAQFLLFISALISAVDTHADMLRRSASNSGNDHRLGANEAPPAIISIFMGEELTKILTSIEKGQKASSRSASNVRIGVDTLPPLPKDNTDRNRTSPFAFTGNKFEFRMVPSSGSISGPSVVLNTIVAEALDEIATRLEKAKDINKEAAAIVRETMKEHGRVIFNGNNYSEEWPREAKKRGLPNITSTVDALKTMVSKTTVDIFKKYKVMSKAEVHARYEIYLEQYSKQINIEAKASLDMAKTLYIPAVIEYTTSLALSISSIMTAGGTSDVQEALLKRATSLLEAAHKNVGILEASVERVHAIGDGYKRAVVYRDKVFTAMIDLRRDIDELEMIIPRKLWPVPTYADLLFKL
ncbi:MAG: glutamine synthetase type III, partial [Candidatus Omnitrophica bacterium]|nr:glutamine synthetase type III [Candidatus Omnitrophota bacterium]